MKSVGKVGDNHGQGHEEAAEGRKGRQPGNLRLEQARGLARRTERLTVMLTPAERERITDYVYALNKRLRAENRHYSESSWAAEGLMDIMDKNPLEKM